MKILDKSHSSNHKGHLKQDQVERRYYHPLMRAHIDFLRQFLPKITTANQVHYNRFLQDGNIRALRHRMKVDKTLQQLTEKVEQAKIERDQLKKAQDDRCKQLMDGYQKESRQWLAQHKSELPAAYIRRKSIDELTKEAMDVVSFAERLDEPYRRQANLAHMTGGVDGNTLFHEALITYAQAFIKCKEQRATDQDRQTLERLRVIVDLLHRHGFSPYRRNNARTADGLGETAYEAADRVCRDYCQEHKQKMTNEESARYRMPDWSLIEMGLKYIPTYSDPAAQVKAALIKYCAKTKKQLNSYFARLFYNLTIKEVYRLWDVSDLMEHTHEAQQELSDEGLMNRIEVLMRDARRGFFGRSELFRELEIILNNFRGGRYSIILPTTQKEIAECRANRDFELKLQAQQEQVLRAQKETEEARRRENEAIRQLVDARAQLNQANTQIAQMQTQIPVMIEAQVQKAMEAFLANRGTTLTGSTPAITAASTASVRTSGPALFANSVNLNTRRISAENTEMTAARRVATAATEIASPAT